MNESDGIQFVRDAALKETFEALGKVLPPPKACEIHGFDERSIHNVYAGNWGYERFEERWYEIHRDSDNVWRYTGGSVSTFTHAQHALDCQVKTVQHGPQRILAGDWGYEEEKHGFWAQLHRDPGRRHPTDNASTCPSTHATHAGEWQYTGEHADHYQDAWRTLMRLVANQEPKT